MVTERCERFHKFDRYRGFPCAAHVDVADDNDGNREFLGMKAAGTILDHCEVNQAQRRERKGEKPLLRPLSVKPGFKLSTHDFGSGRK